MAFPRERRIPLQLRLLAAVVAGLLACGIPLWPIPYQQVNMPGNPSASAWLILGGLAGLMAGYLTRERFWPPVLAVALGFVCAVYGRVEVETSRDPTLHNLWPFEVVIAGGIGLVAAVIGLGVARLLQRAAATE
ncbi:MAG: hypothetical protein ABI766_06365 [Gemmatimonadales bacterium]